MTSSDKDKRSGMEQLPRELLARASEIAKDYKFVIETDAEASFIAFPREMPTVVAAGRTTELALSNARAAAVNAIGILLSRNIDPMTTNPRQIRMQANRGGVSHPAGTAMRQSSVPSAIENTGGADL